jgi:hypothetical protein
VQGQEGVAIALLKRHELVQLVEEHHQLVAKAYQEKDVHKQPRHPGNKAA